MLRCASTGVVALASSLGMLAAGCGGDDDTATAPRAAAKPSASINIASFRFLPEAVTVTAGAKVTWVNADKAPHTAENTGEAGPAQFDTDRLTNGDSKTIVFEKPGQYRYYCIYHRFMRASVTVVK